MLPCPSNDLTVSYNSDPSSDNVLAAVGGHLDVHSSPIVFKGGGHLDVPHPVLEVADLGFSGMYHSCELVDVMVGFGEALVGGCYLSTYRGDEAIGNGVVSWRSLLSSMWRIVSADLGEIGR